MEEEERVSAALVDVVNVRAARQVDELVLDVEERAWNVKGHPGHARGRDALARESQSHADKLENSEQREGDGSDPRAPLRIREARHQERQHHRCAEDRGSTGCR
jgi:hypothetical protein